MSRSFRVQVTNAADLSEAVALMVDTLKLLFSGATAWRTPKAGDPGNPSAEALRIDISPDACLATQTRIAQAFSKAVERVIPAIFSEGFKAGYAEAQAQGIARPEPPASPPRCFRSRQTVQRDPETGEIIGTIAEYDYEDAPGIEPPGP
jgi:hypothetical protein